MLASLQFPHHTDRKSTINAGLLLDQLQALSHPSTGTADSSSDRLIQPETPRFEAEQRCSPAGKATSVAPL